MNLITSPEADNADAEDGDSKGGNFETFLILLRVSKEIRVRDDPVSTRAST